MAAYHPWTKTEKFQTFSCSCLYQILFLGFSNNGIKFIFDMRNQEEIALRMRYTMIMITGKKKLQNNAKRCLQVCVFDMSNLENTLVPTFVVIFFFFNKV